MSKNVTPVNDQILVRVIKPSDEVRPSGFIVTTASQGLSHLAEVISLPKSLPEGGYGFVNGDKVYFHYNGAIDIGDDYKIIHKDNIVGVLD